MNGETSALGQGEGLDDGSWITGLGAPSREAQRYVGVLVAPDPNGNAARTTRAKISKRTRNLAIKSKAWRLALGAGGLVVRFLDLTHRAHPRIRSAASAILAPLPS
jgi:hypothetical protein